MRKVVEQAAALAPEPALVVDKPAVKVNRARQARAPVQLHRAREVISAAREIPPINRALQMAPM